MSWKKLESLLSRGFGVNSALPEGGTLLHKVISQNNFPDVEYLLQQDADVTAVDGRGWQPLHVAVMAKKSKSKERIVAALLEARGSDVDTKTNDRMTSLMMAVA